MQEVQKVQEVVTRTLDEERSCSVPVWITSTGKEKKFQYGLLQQGKRSPDRSAQMLQEGMIGAVFDVGRVSWFQRGLLNGRFSSIVVHRNYKRREFVQS